MLMVLHGTVHSGGSSDIVLLKYSSSGALEFSVLTGTSGDDMALGVAVDSAGSAVYVAGCVGASFDGQEYYGNTQHAYMSCIVLSLYVYAPLTD